MNLKTASDFEINKAVAESLGYVVNPKIGDNDTAFLVDPPFDIGHLGVDYCNQWQDAGPVIKDNEISITSPDDTGTVFWEASASTPDDGCRFCYGSESENPLRAAMECYLMMKTGEL